jgi:membrane-associated phospholipid phosphatase
MNLLRNIKTKAGLNNTEIIFLIYFIITSVYMLIGISSLKHTGEHFLIRILFTLIIFLFSYYGKRIKRNTWFSLIRSIYPLFFLGYLYKETGYLNNILFDYFDPWFVKAEQFLWGMQPSLEFSRLFPERWFSELMNFGYFFYYFLTFGTAIAIYFYNRNKTDQVVFIITTSFLIYYLFFSLFPVEGPQFYFPPEQARTVDGYLFSYLVKIAQDFGETQTGAFPSSHVGLSVVFLILSYKYARKVFYLIIVPVILLWFATVYIKAHYLIDSLCGFPSGLLFYWISSKLYYRMNKITEQ